MSTPIIAGIIIAVAVVPALLVVIAGGMNQAMTKSTKIATITTWVDRIVITVGFTALTGVIAFWLVTGPPESITGQVILGVMVLAWLTAVGLGLQRVAARRRAADEHECLDSA